MEKSQLFSWIKSDRKVNGIIRQQLSTAEQIIDGAANRRTVFAATELRQVAGVKRIRHTCRFVYVHSRFARFAVEIDVSHDMGR